MSYTPPDYTTLPDDVLDVLAVALTHRATCIGTARYCRRDSRKLRVTFRVNGADEAETLRALTGGRLRRSTPSEPRTAVTVEARRAGALVDALWTRLDRETRDRVKAAKEKVRASRSAA